MNTSKQPETYITHELVIEASHDIGAKRVESVLFLGAKVIEILREKGGAAEFGDCVEAMIGRVSSHETGAVELLHRLKQAKIVSFDLSAGGVSISHASAESK